MTTNGRTPPIDAWQVESMRVTAFPHEVVPVERLSWWDQVVGSPPETIQSRPKTGQYEAHGDFEGRRLVLQVQPGRVEWGVARLTKTDEEASVPLLGPFPEVLTSLLKVVGSWLPQAPPLKRLAFGAVLLQPVESVQLGYLLLQKYLPGVAVDPDGSSDLFYQVNRPRPSASVRGMRVNRLTKWSVQLARRVIMTLGPDGLVSRTLGDESACRLELDISTPADFAHTLPGDQLEPILREMIDLGREIAQKGDVK